LILLVFFLLGDGCGQVLLDFFVYLGFIRLDVVSFRLKHLVVQVHLGACDDPHRHEVRIDHRNLKQSVEAVDPEVSFLRGGSQEQQAARVGPQLEGKLPRSLLPVDLFKLADALNADDFASTKQRVSRLGGDTYFKIVLYCFVTGCS